jgi:hypothetical protein
MTELKMLMLSKQAENLRVIINPGQLDDAQTTILAAKNKRRSKQFLGGSREK